MNNKTIKYVLTGNIGCGKTTVANMFKDKGIKIIDADETSRQVFNENIDKIKSIFNTVDRKEISKIVFKEPIEMKKLIDVITPNFNKYIEEQVEIYNKNNNLYFMNIAILRHKKLLLLQR